jgi:hypothetical protein
LRCECGQCFTCGRIAPSETTDARVYCRGQLGFIAKVNSTDKKKSPAEPGF